MPELQSWPAAAGGLDPLPLLSCALLAAKLAALHLPLVFFAARLSFRLTEDEGPPARLLAAAVVYFLAVGLSVWVLPVVSYPWLLAWSWSLGIVGLFLVRRVHSRLETDQDDTPASTPLFGRVMLLWSFLLMAALLVFGMLRPYFDHDPLTYQLHFAAVWLTTGEFSIVPTPFGDPSHAYGPQLASVFYVWLMAPLETDLLAAVGGWFFLLITVLAAAGVARELGARSGLSAAAAVLCFLCPLLAHQGRSALNDAAVAGFFVTAIFFLLRAVRAGGASSLFFALAAAGLLAGTKYTGAPLVLALLPLFVIAAFRVRGRLVRFAWIFGSLAAVAGGGLWYLRNWLLSGNPVFPLQVSLGSRRLFPGLYGREQMNSWIYHQEGFANWVQVISANLNPVLIVICLIVVCRLMIALFRSREKTGLPLLIAFFYTALIPVIIDRLYWQALPFQVDRFWVPAAPVLLALAAAGFSRERRLFMIFPALGYGLLFFYFPETVPWSTGLWLKLAFPTTLIFALVLAWLWRGTANGAAKKRFGVLAPSILTLAFFVLVAAALPRHESRRMDSLSGYEFGPGWVVAAGLGEGRTIAYAGANTPYPLHGPRLANRVVYVSPAGKLMPKDHEALKEFDSSSLAFKTPEPMASGLLLCPRAWAESLVLAEADFLFLMRVPGLVLLNAAHADDGFPIEDKWARSAAELFEPLHLPSVAGDYVRIYRVRHDDPERARSLPEVCALRAPDALSVRLPDRWFPRGREAVRMLERVLSPSEP